MEHHQGQDPLALLETLVRHPDLQARPVLGPHGFRASMPCFQPVINGSKTGESCCGPDGLPPFPRSTSLNGNSPLLSIHYRPSHQLTCWQGHKVVMRGKREKRKIGAKGDFGSSIPRSRPARNKDGKNSSRGQAPIQAISSNSVWRCESRISLCFNILSLRHNAPISGVLYYQGPHAWNDHAGWA